MMPLEDISERLLTRSQEAILQLEIWIQRQQHLRELEDDSIDRLGDQYNIYIAQLNSLCIRSEYVRDKLNKERERRLSLINDRKYIENLVLEFQDITVKLNELAHSRSSNSTPSSKSTRSSLDSFQPKPLKLTERHRSNHIRETRESPLKKKPLRQSVEFTGISESSTSKCLSLPGSPIKEVPSEKSIRMAKSYDTGLRSKKKKSDSQDISSFFKDNQRLSISFFGEYDEEVDSISDQDTVISLSPVCPQKGVPLRRYNSHESILSTKIEPLNFEKVSSAFLLPSSSRPSMTSARVSGAAVFSKTTRPTSSRDLLSSFVGRPSETQIRGGNKQETKSGSFFARWGLFGASSVPSQEQNNNNDSLPQRGSNKPQHTLSSKYHSQNSNASSPHSPKKASSKSPTPLPSKMPVFDSLISYDDLRDALNTELILAAEV